MRNNGPTHKADLHEKPFKPTREVPNPVTAAYDHTADFAHVKKNFKDDEGNVVVAPRNI